MYLVEKHIINRSHPFYDECDSLCFKSKNVYNQGLYNVRQHYFATEKYLNYIANYKVIKQQECYSELPTKVVNQTLKLLDRNFRSFFTLLKNKNVKNRLPNYLDKEKGRFITLFPKQAISIKGFKKTGQICLSKTNIRLNTRITDFNTICEARIIPRMGHYVIEVVYSKQEKPIREGHITSAIDLGLNNLATVTFNNGEQPLLISGKPLKSVNQYYNKKKAALQSKLGGKKHSSNRIEKLTYKRNNKVSDYLHKASRVLVNQLVSKNVSTLVIGKNTSMKQDINIGKVNNQNFVQLPIFKFVDMVKYKCELEGIRVVITEESYTSKCSFFDNEAICSHDVYLGKRIKRGLFRCSDGKVINADVNGSYNIMKKAIPNAFANGTEGLGVNPLLIKVNIK